MTGMVTATMATMMMMTTWPRTGWRTVVDDLQMQIGMMSSSDRRIAIVYLSI